MRKFRTYVYLVLGFNLLVILWGAYVRASGSGAGCGSHWPLCNGVVVPRAPLVETLVEFTHRLTSGLALMLVVALFIWSRQKVFAGHPVRLGAALSLLFIITEALVGAALVLFGWVANDDSLGRVISISVHLINTFLLLASLTLTAWWASGGGHLHLRRQGIAGWALGAGMFAVLILGVTGAITALGDTLFPAGSLAEGFQQDFSPTSHFLLRLRFWHPVVAIVTGFYLVFVAALLASLRGGKLVRRFAWTLGFLFILQLCAGLVNLLLLAPIPMQLIHLLLADAVWIALILLSAATFQAIPQVLTVEGRSIEYAQKTG